MDSENLLLLTDSYKLSHWQQYPMYTKGCYHYFESRTGAKFPSTCFFGLQYLLKKYLTGQVVTQEKIDEAQKISDFHINKNVFNKYSWKNILTYSNGYLPISIKAVPEGTCVNTSNVLFTVESTCRYAYWLPGYIGSLLTQCWYPSTVATISKEMKNIISHYLPLIDTSSRMHDFGFRGSTSVESAALGGAAHLINFIGTDNIPAINLIRKYYYDDMAGCSIAAAEHDSILSWGREGEFNAIRNLLLTFSREPLSIVADTYNLDGFFEHLKKLWDFIKLRTHNLVIRPDSGLLPHSLIYVLETLGRIFGYTYDIMGFKLLAHPFKVLQGDGISLDNLKSILQAVYSHGWSIENLYFGCGSGLLQSCNRDTQRFAYKLSNWQGENDTERDVYKCPATDMSKSSKAGKLKLVKEGKNYRTVKQSEPGEDCLVEVFRDGKILKEYTLGQIRSNANMEC